MLTKPQTVTFIPGKPEVEARAAYEVCTVPPYNPGDGHWEQVCEYSYYPIAVVTGPTPGAYPVDPGPFPYVLYAGSYTCKTVWVP